MHTVNIISIFNGFVINYQYNSALITFVPVFVNEQEAVQSGVAKLPCNIAPSADDKAHLVIWYKEGVTKPIYT